MRKFSCNLCISLEFHGCLEFYVHIFFVSAFCVMSLCSLYFEEICKLVVCMYFNITFSSFHIYYYILLLCCSGSLESYYADTFFCDDKKVKDSLEQTYKHKSAKVYNIST